MFRPVVELHLGLVFFKNMHVLVQIPRVLRVLPPLAPHMVRKTSLNKKKTNGNALGNSVEMGQRTGGPWALHFSYE